jgi:hypothetical protein
LFLVGGGFVTLLYGVMATIAATKIGAPLTWCRAHLPARLSRLLARLWPWLLAIYLCWVAAAWVIGALFNDFMLRLTPATTVVTPVGLALILVAGFAYDTRTRSLPNPESR